MYNEIDQLLEKGYLVLKKIIPLNFIDELILITNKLLNEQSDQERDKQKSTGSMINISKDPFFADLISYKTVLETLKKVGIHDLRFSSGYIISKPAFSEIFELKKCYHTNAAYKAYKSWEEFNSTTMQTPKGKYKSGAYDDIV